MGRKLKFKPTITRVKLNPEQAVLTCTCYDASKLGTVSLSAKKASTRSCDSFRRLHYTKAGGTCDEIAVYSRSQAEFAQS